MSKYKFISILVLITLLHQNLLEYPFHTGFGMGTNALRPRASLERKRPSTETETMRYGYQDYIVHWDSPQRMLTELLAMFERWKKTRLSKDEIQNVQSLSRALSATYVKAREAEVKGAMYELDELNIGTKYSYPFICGPLTQVLGLNLRARNIPSARVFRQGIFEANNWPARMFFPHFNQTESVHVYEVAIVNGEAVLIDPTVTQFISSEESGYKDAGVLILPIREINQWMWPYTTGRLSQISKEGLPNFLRECHWSANTVFMELKPVRSAEVRRHDIFPPLMEPEPGSPAFTEMAFARLFYGIDEEFLAKARAGFHKLGQRQLTPEEQEKVASGLWEIRCRLQKQRDDLQTMLVQVLKKFADGKRSAARLRGLLYAVAQDVFAALTGIKDAYVQSSIIENDPDSYADYKLVDIPESGLSFEATNPLKQAADAVGVPIRVMAVENSYFDWSDLEKTDRVHVFAEIKTDDGPVAVDLCSGVFLPDNAGRIVAMRADQYIPIISAAVKRWVHPQNLRWKIPRVLALKQEFAVIYHTQLVGASQEDALRNKTEGELQTCI